MHTKSIAFFSVLSAFLISTIAQAGYQTLPTSGCPSQGQFNLNHFAEEQPITGSNGTNSADVVSSRIYRGGAPAASGIECLHSEGVTVVFDVRKESEHGNEPALVAAQGMTYYAFPMTADPKIPGSQACQQKGLNATQCNEQSALAAIDQLEQLLVSNPNAKVFIHCSRGQDRTGLVIGLFRVLKQGCSSTTARAEMDDFQFTPFQSLETSLGKVPII